jgi:hypothetical protein
MTNRALAALALLVLVGVPTAFASTGDSPAPVPADAAARAWALHVSFVAGDAHSFRIAEASAENGSSSSALAAPMIMDGNGVNVASAIPSRPDDVQTPVTWTDQTGSLSLEGWFSEAHARDASSSARSGFAGMTGSGFALADELFSWEQQEQLLGQWTTYSELVADQINAVLLPLAPFLAAAGIVVPVIEAPPAVGLVNVASGSQVASTAETASGPGFASARAETSLSSVKMLAGFLQADGVAARAVSEGAADTQTLDASAHIGRLRLAGIEVEADEEGLSLASTDVVSRTVIAPVFDAVVGALASAGVTIRAADSRADPQTGLRQASALEIEVATPQGSLLVSLAHAEARAQAETVPVVADGEPVVPVVDATSDEIQVLGEGGVRDRNVATVVDVGPESGGAQASGPFARTLPASAVRGARTAFLVLAVGGALGALLVPMLIGSVGRRREVLR